MSFLPTIFTVITAVILLVLIIVALAGTFYTVTQQTAVIIERFGKFRKVANPGLNVKVPFIDRKAAILELRVQQMDVKVETKTKDNVFTNLSLSIQFNILPNSVRDSYYRLQNPEKQIESYVFDAVRSQIPALDLDDVFAKKDDIATQVNEALSEDMSNFGYQIVKTLVTDVDPDPKVKESMNAINAAIRQQQAATAQGEAEKIKVVKNAEAEAESKRLQGEGIANQRKAIAAGLRESVQDIKDGLGTDNSESAMQLVLLTQYFDTLTNLGNNGATTILLPGGPSGVKDLGNQIVEAMTVSGVTVDSVRAAVEADAAGNNPVASAPKRAK